MKRGTQNIRAVKFQELLSIRNGESSERLVPVDSEDQTILRGASAFLHIPDKYKKHIYYARQDIVHRLARVNTALKKEYPGLTLKVFYAYRPLCLQEKYFSERKQFVLTQGETFDSETELLDRLHQEIALPDLAGHPTGGAVDLTIFNIKEERDLDMGTELYDFSDDHRMSWRCKDLSEEQNNNRILLFKLMTNEGFAPYWGEWWHYSYGDKEWAAYYGKNKTVYGKVTSLIYKE